jgi:hypothetical protein
MEDKEVVKLGKRLLEDYIWSWRNNLDQEIIRLALDNNGRKLTDHQMNLLLVGFVKARTILLHNLEPDDKDLEIFYSCLDEIGKQYY